jgi:tetratricopeptide (TPR) repeat protein
MYAETTYCMAHRKSWDFLKCFILADGLTALIPFLVDGNLYARGQAVELLLSVTDCDSYVWFRTGDDALLEHEALCYRLFRIIHHENFLKNLLQNRASSYPGGSYNCLQLIAFSLSWIRTKYSPTKKLRLHENIMDALRLWAQTDPGCHDHECADTSEELPEVKLAKTLCEDFGREPTISISENSFLFAFHGITTPGNFVDDSIPNKAISEMRALKAQRSQIDLRSAEELKEEGNKLYKVQNYVDAYKMFQLATNRLSKSDIASSLAITLWFNLATVNWKFAEICEENLLKNVVPELNCVCLDASLHSTHQCSSDENIWEARRLCHLRESETLSTKAIEFSDSLHIKAIFRKASCLLALGSPKMAFEVADKAIESLKRDAGAATDLSGDVDSIALLKGVQRKCMAAVLTNDEHLLQTAASLDAVTLNSNGEVVSSSVAASEVVLSGLSQLATSEHSAMPMSASTASILLKLRARASHSDAISTHPSSSAPVAEGQLSDAVVPSAINEPLAGASHSLDRSTLSGAPKHPSKTSFSVAAPSTVMKPRVTGKKVKDLTAKNAALERASVLKKHLKSLKSELSKDSCSIDGIKSVKPSYFH